MTKIKYRKWFDISFYVSLYTYYTRFKILFYNNEKNIQIETLTIRKDSFSVVKVTNHCTLHFSFHKNNIIRGNFKYKIRKEKINLYCVRDCIPLKFYSKYLHKTLLKSLKLLQDFQHIYNPIMYIQGFRIIIISNNFIINIFNKCNNSLVNFILTTTTWFFYNRIKNDR